MSKTKKNIYSNRIKYTIKEGKLVSGVVKKSGAAPKKRVSEYQKYKKAYAAEEKAIKIRPSTAAKQIKLSSGEFRTFKKMHELATGKKLQIKELVQRQFYGFTDYQAERVKQAFVDNGFADQMPSDEELKADFKGVIAKLNNLLKQAGINSEGRAEVISYAYGS